ncbi:MAG: DsbA family protein [Sandaracinus sp.]|nr:DsbA family protein [Sandaracinus sp.]
MNARRFVLAVALATAFVGCDESSDEEDVVENVPLPGRPEEAAPAIAEIPGVSLDGLGASDRRLALRLLNEILSPCGEPVSLARCVSERSTCGDCLVAARYVARLAAEGLADHEIRALVQGRFDPAAKVEIETGDAPVRGATMGAPVQLIVFSDFECPFCRQTHPLLQRALREHDGQVQLVFKNYPLSMHERALPAAIAAYAAHKQGKFWEMHDMLFEHQEALTDADLEGYARELGLDLDRFRADVADEASAAAVEADKTLGRSLEVQGTPTLFVNGRRFEEPFENLSRYIAEELERR